MNKLMRSREDIESQVAGPGQLLAETMHRLHLELLLDIRALLGVGGARLPSPGEPPAPNMAQLGQRILFLEQTRDSLEGAKKQVAIALEESKYRVNLLLSEVRRCHDAAAAPHPAQATEDTLKNGGVPLDYRCKCDLCGPREPLKP